MKVIFKSGIKAEWRLLPRGPVSYSFESMPRITEPGTTSLVTDNDAVLVRHEGATVVWDAQIYTDLASGAPRYRSANTDVGIIDRSGRVTWISDGVVRVVAISGLSKRLIRVPVHEEEGIETDEFDSWIDGSLARYSSDFVDGSIDGLTPESATLDIFSSVDHTSAVYVRNPSLWCAAINLTGWPVWNSRTGQQFGSTLITPRHIATSAHGNPVQPGDSLRWVSAANVVHTRTVLSAYNVPGTDIRICVLSSDLPSEIQPMKIAPVDIRDYLANIQFGVPCINRNQYGEARISEIIDLDADRAIHRVPYYVSEERKAWARLLDSGDSGGSSVMIVNGMAVFINSWTQQNNGPSYHAREWPAIIAAADAPAEIERTNFLFHSADFTNAVWVKEGTPGTPTLEESGEGDFKLTLPNSVFGAQYAMFRQANNLDPGTYTAQIKLRAGTLTNAHLIINSGSGRGAYANLSCELTEDLQIFHVTFTVETSYDYVFFDVGFNGYMGDTSDAGFFYVADAQIELGSVATPLIVTGGSALTVEGTGYLPVRADMTFFTDFTDPLAGIAGLKVWRRSQRLYQHEDYAITGDGDPVGVWASNRGNEFRMIEDWAKRPHLAGGWVAMDNVDDRLSLPHTRTSEYTAIVRIKLTTIANETRFFGVNHSYVGIESSNSKLTLLNEGMAWDYSGGVVPALNQVATLRVVRESATLIKLWLDGTLLSTISGAQAADPSGVISLLHGSYAGFAYADRILTSDEIEAVEADLEAQTPFPTFGQFFTHYGDNVPVGMYQDPECTIRSLVADDVVIGFRDENTGLTFIDEGPDPSTLQFYNGVPVIRTNDTTIFRLTGIGGLFSGNASACAQLTIAPDGGEDTAYGLVSTVRSDTGPWGRFPDNGFSYPWFFFPDSRIDTFRQMPTSGALTYAATHNGTVFSDYVNGVFDQYVAKGFSVNGGDIYLLGAGPPAGGCNAALTGFVFGPAWTEAERLAAGALCRSRHYE